LSQTSSGATDAKKSEMEKGLEKMESLLRQSAQGIHVLFDNEAIARAMGKKIDQKEFLDFNKMKKIQDIMTDLVSRNTYYDKVAFLERLDQDSYDMLVRTYFHIVENTVRSNFDLSH
jgi:hypothetical protein